MQRALLVVLLAANVLFFGWARGWFAPGWAAPQHSQREPDRSAAQVRPELITVVAVGNTSTKTNTSAGAPSAVAAADGAETCLEAGPFSESNLAGAEKALNLALPSTAFGVRSERGADAQNWLRADRADGALLAQLRGLKLAVLGAGFVPCRVGR